MTAHPSNPAHTSNPARPLRIGITGPIGCGKSTVASWLGDLGAVVIDADQVAREVTPVGSAELAAVVAAFGRDILRADGSLDRPALGRIVFADASALARLESIIHPTVRVRILDLLAEADRSSAPAVVIEAIKLVEGGLASLCDEVWLVTCDPAVQRVRLAARSAASAAPTNSDANDVDANDAGADAVRRATDAGEAAAKQPANSDVEAVRRAADAEARIAAQGDLVARLTRFATRILDTSGSIAESRSRVAAAWADALAATRP